jgi:hypothetical protein
MDNYKYHAFISYSHVDAELARALQRALERFAKPWYRRRALNVFRDQTNLSASPAIWQDMARALSASQCFILLASPEAAESEWVYRQSEQFLKQHSAEHVVVVLTAGKVVWSQINGDFDWNETDALPQVLKGKFEDEPLLIDLRDVHDHCSNEARAG